LIDADTTAALSDSILVRNQGAGGVYNLGTFLTDALTRIRHNHASTSDDDCFGC
jgi:hypothetical protein